MIIKQRIAFFTLSIIFVQVLLQILVSENGLRSSLKLAKDKRAVRVSLAYYQDENRMLVQSIQRIKHEEGLLEEQARFRIGLIGAGEQFSLIKHQPIDSS